MSVALNLCRCRQAKPVVKPGNSAMTSAFDCSVRQRDSDRLPREEAHASATSRPRGSRGGLRGGVSRVDLPRRSLADVIKAERRSPSVGPAAGPQLWGRAAM
jgi:hypothetical protein